MRNIKMIVTDLDGTLLHTNKSVSEYTMQMLKECQKRGIVVVIATARFWIGAERYIDLLQPDYVISSDGTMIHNEDRMIAENSFDLQISNQLIRMIQDANKSTEIITAVGKKVLWNSFHISESDKLYKAEYFDYKSPILENVHKIVAELPNKETAADIAQTCKCKLITYRGENLYAFIPFDAGKLTMIQQLADKLSISLSEIAAFGDDENDVGMLEACGLGVAVSNALLEVKEIADELTMSNDEDGVAWFIEKKIFI